MPASVCLATYNGLRYLEPQVQSILEQLGATDELLVVDDCSSDGTVQWLLALQDPRITVHVNEVNCGPNQTFAKAMYLARHEFLFLADQDDIWAPGRFRAMLGALAEGDALLVSANQTHIDSAGHPLPHTPPALLAEDSGRALRNLWGICTGQRPYFGCAMALKRQLCGLVLPIPAYVESHDLWIAMGANLCRRNLHLERVSLLRRIHGNNASLGRRPLWKKVVSRWIHLRSLGTLLLRMPAFLAARR
ncbi:glycosyltransferase [Silanimonas sp.]|jgi:glycosyltransferase involved in cell wall biosynthesis|uniref:glycosyltransferase n=1 Tax=Silanimonas sp. TaxID=1929290 RepID=UPI0022BE03EB|nr:glycosyltransferase [Silanimonas sp.]MCZ8167493.1 glycosyltransferase [Silanimonas sp.]